MEDNSSRNNSKKAFGKTTKTGIKPEQSKQVKAEGSKIIEMPRTSKVSETVPLTTASTTTMPAFEPLQFSNIVDSVEGLSAEEKESVKKAAESIFNTETKNKPASKPITEKDVLEARVAVLEGEVSALNTCKKKMTKTVSAIAVGVFFTAISISAFIVVKIRGSKT